MNPGPKTVTYLLGNENLPITDTLIVSWVVVILLIIVARIATRNMKIKPTPVQNVFEFLIETIYNQIEPMLPGEGWKYLPFIATIFLYVGLNNLIGLIPVPGNTSPTGDLNVTVALAIIVFIVSHVAAVRETGLWEYLKGFAEPVVFLLPINIVGELAKPISHSFRLFGNVVGGGIIITLLYQAFPWVIPVPFHLWFDIFVGLIQTLIFGMIAIAYISVAKQ